MKKIIAIAALLLTNASFADYNSVITLDNNFKLDFENPISQTYIAEQFKKENNLLKSFEWMKKAAEQELPMAMHNIAVMTEKGMGTKQDKTLAIELYKKAAGAGVLGSQVYLAEHFKALGDFEASFKYFKMAADQKNPKSIYYTGKMILSGLGNSLEKSVGITYLESLVPMDHTKAILELGIAHLNGVGTPVDYNKAKSYLETAAKRHQKDAALTLAKMYYKGIAGAVDYKLAGIWFQRALNDGNGEGAYFLANMHLIGMGVQRDIEKGIKFLHSGVRKNNAESMTRLGLITMQGLYNVETDLEEGVKLLDRAAHLGDQEALNVLNKLFIDNSWGIRANKKKAQFYAQLKMENVKKSISINDFFNDNPEEIDHETLIRKVMHGLFKEIKEVPKKLEIRQGTDEYKLPIIKG